MTNINKTGGQLCERIDKLDKKLKIKDDLKHSYYSILMLLLMVKENILKRDIKS